MACEFCLCIFYLLPFNLSITYHLYHLSLLFINHLSGQLSVNHLSCLSFVTCLLSIYPVCLSAVLHLSLVTIPVMLVPSTGTCSRDHALKWSLDQLTQLDNCFSVHLSQSIVVTLQSKTDHGIQAHAIRLPTTLSLRRKSSPPDYQALCHPILVTSITVTTFLCSVPVLLLPFWPSQDFCLLLILPRIDSTPDG